MRSLSLGLVTIILFMSLFCGTAEKDIYDIEEYSVVIDGVEYIIPGSKEDQTYICVINGTQFTIPLSEMFPMASEFTIVEQEVFYQNILYLQLLLLNEENPDNELCFSILSALYVLEAIQNGVDITGRIVDVCRMSEAELHNYLKQFGFDCVISEQDNVISVEFVENVLVKFNFEGNTLQSAKIEIQSIENVLGNAMALEFSFSE